MTNMKEKVIFSWSGGKDSAMALWEVLREGRYEVVSLLCSIAEEYGRISHHGVREEMLDRQAEALGLPIDKVYLPTSGSHPCTNNVYEEIMREHMYRYQEQGIKHVVFGDIFLEDLREYREKNLAQVDMTGIFPLWKRDTTQIVHDWIDAGFRAYTCCVEGKLGRSFVGRALDAQFVRDLPDGIDPCGEYGEFHSFVFDGPVFREPVPTYVGQIVERDTRFYADLVSSEEVAAPQTVDHSIPPVV